MVSASANEKIETSVNTDNGYARFSITLSERTKFADFTSSDDNNVLVVRFSEPVKVDLERELRGLSNYVRVARSDPEGDTFRIALGAGVTTNVMAAGEHLYIDFLPPNWRGLPPPLPENVVRKLERRAEEALKLLQFTEIGAAEKKEDAELEIRLGRHPTFSRFVFKWNVNFDARFERSGEGASVTFNQRAVVNVAPINADLPPLVTQVATVVEEADTSFVLSLDPDAKVRSYREGKEFVVDITSDELAAKSAGLQQPQKLFGALPEIPEGATASSDAVLDASEREVAKLGPVPSLSVAEELISSEKAATGDTSSEPLQDSSSSEIEQEGFSSKEVVKVVPDGEENKRDVAGNVAKNVESVPVDERFENRTASAWVAQTVDNSIQLNFTFLDEVPATVFRRGKAIWMLFKTDQELETENVESVLGNRIERFDFIEQEGFRGVRLQLPKIRLASVNFHETTWTVTISEQIEHPSTPIQINRAFSNSGLYKLDATLAGEKAIGQVLDPVVMDEIQFIAVKMPIRGVINRRTMVDGELLASVQGMAYVPHHSGIGFKADEDQVSIESDDGLKLSQLVDQHNRLLPKAITKEWFDRPFFTPTQFKVPTIGFKSLESNLRKAVVDAGEDEIDQRRIELAHFYLANDLASEALGILKTALAKSPALDRKIAFDLTLAQANLAARRYDDAFLLLTTPHMQENPFGAVLLTIAAHGKAKHLIALEAAKRGQDKLAPFPKDVQHTFFLAAAEAAIELKSLEKARKFLANVVLHSGTAYQKGWYDLLQARMLASEGKIEDAMSFVARALENDDEIIKARSTVEKIEFELMTDARSREKIIEELEQFVAVWRKDETELRALKLLTDLTAEANDFRRSFELARSAVLSDPNSATTHEIQDNMQDVFVDLFHKGYSSKLPASDALALYYDFQELMPVGRVGDEIVRNLAAQLVDIDLLTQAGEVLEHQVNNRLKGASRARVAADLAVVHLLNEQPHRALSTLRVTQTAGLPSSLVRQRRMVEAYALSTMGKMENSLDLLTPYSGEDVERLRANAKWNNGAWQQAGEQFEKMHSDKWNSAAPLSAQTRLDILRAAISYALAGDDFSLNRLHQKFGQKMADSQDAYPFEVLSKAGENAAFEAQLLMDSVLSANTVDSFLEDYRRRYLRRNIAA